MLDELVKFAKKNHPGFAAFEDELVKRFFETLRETTLVSHRDGEIQGFAIYANRPEGIYFFCIVGTKDRRANLMTMLKNIRQFRKGKKIMWHDEARKLHICRYRF